MAQLDYYQALVIDGTVLCQTPPSLDWQSLVPGTKLKSTDVVKLADKSYAGFIHSSGKILELKKAGNYPLNNYQENFKGPKYALPALDSVIAWVIRDQKELKDSSYFKRYNDNIHDLTHMHGGGAEDIMFTSHKRMFVYDSLFLNWTCCRNLNNPSYGKKDLTFEFVVVDLYQNILLDVITKDTFYVSALPYDSSGRGLVCSIWDVKIPYSSGGPQLLYLPAEKKNQVKTDLAKLKTIFKSESALSYTIF